MTGTLINVVTILAGGSVGLLLGNRLPERARELIMSTLGLVTMVMGVKMAIGSHNILIVLFSVLIGGLLGYALGIENRLNALGDWFQRRAAARGAAGSGRVSEAFVTASLIFCVGPLAVVGAIQDGLLGDFELLAVKSLMDGFAAMAFAAALGWGVLLSALSILVYQGGISLAAMALAGIWVGGLSETSPAVVELTAVGGILIAGIGLTLLEIKRVRVGDMLPSLAIAPLLVWVLTRLGIAFA